MFVQTEETPNPDALKFYPGSNVNTDAPVHYSKNQTNIPSPIARRLFEIEGVEGVFFGFDFITLTKSSNFDWSLLKPEILMIIGEHFSAQLPVFDDMDEEESEQVNYENLSEIEQQIVEIINTRVRPAVAMDGGDIIYKKFENGIVKLELKGACSGCPSSLITLKNGIESMLKHYVPEVEHVEAVE